jgi:hypothetical protein
MKEEVTIRTVAFMFTKQITYSRKEFFFSRVGDLFGVFFFLKKH